MKIEPLLTYRRPKYPRIGENIKSSNSFLLEHRNKAITAAAVLTISSVLAGCGVRTAGAPAISEYPPESDIEINSFTTAGTLPPPRFLSEQEVVQILRYEAEDMGVDMDAVFGEQQNTTAKFYDVDIDLDFYNEEKRVGIAFLEEYQGNILWEIEERDVFIDAFVGGMTAHGSIEDEQPVDFFMASEVYEGSDGELRQAFREFIEWLQSEGII